MQPNASLVAYVSVASTAVVAVATVLLAVFTWKYMRLTGSLVQESRRLRDPLVTVDFEMPDHSLNLAVENHGLSPARDVRIEVLQDSEWIRAGKDEVGLKGIEPVVKGVSYLTPGRKLKYRVGFLDWRNKPDHPTVSLRVSYSSLDGEVFERVIDFDFEQLSGVLFDSFRDPIQTVAEAIRDVERNRESRGRLDEVFAPATKPCRMCAETILADAKKCWHCSEMQAPARRPTRTSSGRRKR